MTQTSVPVDGNGKYRRPLHLRFRRHNSTGRLRFWGPWIGVTLVLLIVGWLFIKPAPPSRIVIATGNRDGAYHWFAEQYAKTFAKSNVKLEIRETAGTVENYSLLDNDAGKGESGVSVAFAQGGSCPEGIQSEIRSIASLYLEPVWVFYRGEPTRQLPGLRGKRIAVGPEGSGVRSIALRLLGASGAMTPGDLKPDDTKTRPADEPVLVPLVGRPAADALRRGEIDAAFLVTSPRDPNIAMLLREPGVSLMSFERHEAYARIYPYLSEVKLPRGTIDLVHDLPANDVYLLAPAANLVCRNDLHPAIVGLLIKSARAAFEHGDLLSSPAEFPSLRYTEFPVDDAAREYFRAGPGILQRYLPFWVAAFVDRMKILLLPLITLLIPLARLAPPIYVWRMRSRIYNWYRVLREIDQKLREDLASTSPSTNPKRFDPDLADLQQMERELGDVNVPLGYMQEFYNLRLHTDFLQRKLKARIDESNSPPATPVMNLQSNRT